MNHVAYATAKFTRPTPPGTESTNFTCTKYAPSIRSQNIKYQKKKFNKSMQTRTKNSNERKGKNRSWNYVGFHINMYSIFHRKKSIRNNNIMDLFSHSCLTVNCQYFDSISINSKLIIAKLNKKKSVSEKNIFFFSSGKNSIVLLGTRHYLEYNWHIFKLDLEFINLLSFLMVRGFFYRFCLHSKKSNL